jgi:hypothetical protein
MGLKVEGRFDGAEVDIVSGNVILEFRNMSPRESMWNFDDDSGIVFGGKI